MQKKNKAQVSLELAGAIICIFILLLASVKLCTWAVGRMVVRQENFENSRVEAGSTIIGEEVVEPTQELQFDYIR